MGAQDSAEPASATISGEGVSPAARAAPRGSPPGRADCTARAERGRFPAIDLLRSVSRSLPEAADEAENKLISHARGLLGAYDRAELMIQAGLYAKGSDPLVDEAIKVWPALDGFLGEDAPTDGIAGSFERLQAVLQTR